MKALVISRLGDPDVLEVRSVPDPVPASGQELIQVEAGGINFADIMSAKAAIPEPRNRRWWRDANSAELASPTANASWDTRSGEHSPNKSPRRPHLLWPVPADGARKKARRFRSTISPPTSRTGRRACSKTAGPAPRVLIHAVAGGVGTAAVQIGKLLGIEMYGTSSSEEKLARVKTLGLQHGINYKQRDYEEAIKDLTHGEGVDAVFEMLGGEHTAKSVRCLRDFGRVIVYGAATGQPAHLDARILYAKGASVHGLWLTYLSAKRELMNQAWEQLSAWMAQGHLRPVVGNVFPLEQAPDAYRLLLERKNFGKVVLKLV